MAGNTVLFRPADFHWRRQSRTTSTTWARFNVDDGPGFGAEITNVQSTAWWGRISPLTSPTLKKALAATRTPTPHPFSPTTVMPRKSPSSNSLTRRVRSPEVNSGYVLDNVTATGFEDILLGDFNFDGTIDVADYTILQDNFGTGTTFGEGDLNFDGTVGLDDFIALKAAFNAPAGAAAVPEPAGRFSLLGIASVALLLRRRRLRSK